MLFEDLQNILLENRLPEEFDFVLNHLQTDPLARVHLNALLTSEHPALVHGGMGVAFNLDPEWTVQASDHLLQHPLEEVRLDFVGYLSTFPDPKTTDLLLQTLKKDPSDEVRCAAVEALGKVAGMETISEIFEAIQQDETHHQSQNREGKTLMELGVQAIEDIQARQWITG